MKKDKEPAEKHLTLLPKLDFTLKQDGFVGSLHKPERDEYPGKALICFSGSDGRFELTQKLAAIFQSHGLTVLALAYVMEEGLPDRFYHVPIDPIEAAAWERHSGLYTVSTAS